MLHLVLLSIKYFVLKKILYAPFPLQPFNVQGIFAL